MNRLSLRTRLVAVAVALVAFAVTATGAATYVALRTYLYGRIDQQVSDLAVDPLHRICTPGNGPGEASPLQAPYATVIDHTGAQGTVVCPGFRLARTLALSPADASRLAAVAGETQPFGLRDTRGASYRAVAQPVQGDVLAIALPTSEADGTLGRLLGLELVVGAVALIGTGVLGAAGVRLGMRPLDRVTRTARTVAAELGPDGRGLDRRVPVVDPHTEVGQLSEAVNTMLDAVEREYAARWESEQRMRRFLADASHELRTPLTSLRGYAELVRLRGGLDEQAADSLRRIESEGTRMSRLVEDLLTLARSDRGVPVDRAPVDVSDVVDDAVAGLRAAHPDREVRVSSDTELPVLGDRDQLLQVVGNVLTNAAVHATGGGPIAVTADRQDGEVVVRVADAGPGLPPELAAQVFDRFWRADLARTRARGGSGLGLSIVRALVAGHGGKVSFDSAVAEGTTVTVRLPAAPDGPAAPEVRDYVSGPGRGP